MKISEAYPSKYLKAADLGGQPKTVTIRHIEKAKVGMDQEERYCMSLVGESKQLVLNKTNMSSLGQIFPDANLEDLPGKQVRLVVREVDFNGETHSAIRIAAAKPTIDELFAAKPENKGNPY